MAFECGYQTIFLGEDSFPMNLGDNKGDSVLKVPRLSDRYIYRLPGEQQKRMLEVFLENYKTNLNLFN